MTLQPVRVLVIGDLYFPVPDFRNEFEHLDSRVWVEYLQIESNDVPPTRTDSEARLREYAGDPADITKAAQGHDVLVVHGAPVSEETLSVPGLRLVCCARGGPVNVDVAAATKRGIAVCNSPGKNAAAVAELTIAFALMQIRRVPASSHDVLAGKAPGPSVFDGREYFGAEAPSTTLGLVGYGQVGRQVAERARSLGFTVIVHDPFVSQADPGIDLVGMEELLGRADVVSLHVRLTPETNRMMGAQQFSLMRPGAYFINTAREQLVDEAALLDALTRGTIAGAAMDVIERPDSGRNPLLDLPSVVVTPHIGGATKETLARGAQMAVQAVTAFIEGDALPYLVNPDALVQHPDN